ncbi:hypothetical protein SLEP1_g14355 [Rubroshorea leprosula]|uniref:Uncharacterized protein n=1 Tax=Rubroshorea leprosula TaxID=152421 RepID=A0AAV5IIR7_9ROSI|nr:hypothetical protein SLEP1_g14355 [Rubroshorea leprosula]
MSSTDKIILRAQVAEMEAIHRTFRAIWFTDARRFVRTLHFQEVGAEFWLHEKWLMRVGLLEEDDNNLPGINTALLGEVGAQQDVFPTEIKLVKDESGVKEITFFIPQLMAKFRLSTADWVSMREAKKLFGSCCFKLQRYVQIAYEGGMLVETNRDVATMQLTCAWSTTVAGEDMNLIVEVQGAGTMTEDLYPEAVEDICTRNLADIMFVINTGMNGDGILKGMDARQPYDAEFWMPEQGQAGRVTVLWNSRTVNLMCGSWKVGGVSKSWISVISRYDEDETW